MLNNRLALKVLKEIDEEFKRIEGTLLSVQNEDTRIILFKELRELRVCNEKLKVHFEKVCRRQNGQ